MAEKAKQRSSAGTDRERDGNECDNKLHEDPGVRDSVTRLHRKILFGGKKTNQPKKLSDDKIKSIVMEAAEDSLGMEIEPSTVHSPSWRGLFDGNPVNLHEDPGIRNRVRRSYRQIQWEAVPNGRNESNQPEKLSDDTIRSIVMQAAGDSWGIKIDPSSVDAPSWRGVLDPIDDEVVQKWENIRTEKLPILSKKLGQHVQARKELYQGNGSLESWFEVSIADEEKVERLVDESGPWESDLEKKALIDALKATQKFQLSLSPAATKKRKWPTSTPSVSPVSKDSPIGSFRSGQDRPTPTLTPTPVVSQGHVTTDGHSDSSGEVEVLKFYSDAQVEARRERNQAISFEPIQQCEGFNASYPEGNFNRKEKSREIKSVVEFKKKLESAGVTDPIVHGKNNNLGNLGFPNHAKKSNGNAIEIGAGMLGDVVKPPEESHKSCDGRLLRQHVETVAGYEVVQTDITFDQLVSGFIPPDAPWPITDYVAIVYFEDDEAKWSPHVYHPGTGMILPTSNGGAKHLGTDTRNKCKEEQRKDRKKAAVNVAQSTLKEENGAQQTCPRTQIYYLWKVRKQRAKTNPRGK